MEARYTITDETGCHTMYIYNVNLDVLYDVIAFKAECPKARVPKELWEELLMVLDKLGDVIEEVNKKCTAVYLAAADFDRLAPCGFQPGRDEHKERAED